MSGVKLLFSQCCLQQKLMRAVIGNIYAPKKRGPSDFIDLGGDSYKVCESQHATDVCEGELTGKMLAGEALPRNSSVFTAADGGHNEMLHGGTFILASGGSSPQSLHCGGERQLRIDRGEERERER